MAFGQRIENFHLFRLSILGQENMVDDILEIKNAFLDYKNKGFKNLKNSNLFKGVSPWIWSKN